MTRRRDTLLHQPVDWRTPPAQGSPYGRLTVSTRTVRSASVAKVGDDPVMVRELCLVGRANTHELAGDGVPAAASARPCGQHVVEAPIS